MWNEQMRKFKFQSTKFIFLEILKFLVKNVIASEAQSNLAFLKKIATHPSGACNDRCAKGFCTLWAHSGNCGSDF